jgi:hypothetical protein
MIEEIAREFDGFRVVRHIGRQIKYQNSVSGPPFRIREVDMVGIAQRNE